MAVLESAEVAEAIGVLWARLFSLRLRCAVLEGQNPSLPSLCSTRSAGIRCYDLLKSCNVPVAAYTLCSLARAAKHAHEKRSLSSPQTLLGHCNTAATARHNLRLHKPLKNGMGVLESFFDFFLGLRGFRAAS